MIRLLAGYKTQNINEVPTVIHVGDNGAVLHQVASEQGGKGYVRMRWFQLDGGIPVQVPAVPVAATAEAKADESASEPVAETAPVAEVKPKKKASKKTASEPVAETAP